MICISAKKKRKLLLLLVLAVVLFLILKLLGNLNACAERFASNEAGATLSLTLQEALYEKMSESNRNCFAIKTDPNGKITAVQTDGNELTLLASELSVCLIETLREYNSASFGIPLGNVFSSVLLSGRGPVIPIRPVLSGNAASAISTELQSAGINQSLYRIVITFDVSIGFLAPFSMYDCNARFDIVVSEILVVGEIPIVYSDQSSLR